MNSFLRRILSPRACIIALLFFGCSGPKSPTSTQSSADQVGPKGQEKTPALAQSEAVGEKDARSKEQELIGEYRTWFRAVLSGGFRTRPKTISDQYVTYCRSSFKKLVKDPAAVRSFLEGKLRNGRIQERPLAIQLLGELGPAGAASARYIATVLVRSWDVALNRCLAKRTGSKMGGRPVEASEEIRSECISELQGSRPPTSVSMACRALENIGEPKGVEQILKTGMGGHFARPCTQFLVSHNLDSAAVLRFIAGEIDGKPNGDLLWSALVRRGPEGMGAMIRILEARARSGKVYDEAICLSARFTQSYRAEGGSAGDLSDETQSRIEQLSSGRLSDGHIVPESLVRCARQIRKMLKAPAPKHSRPLRSPMTRPEFGPFCPDGTAPLKGRR